MAHGFSLRKAHETLNKITSREPAFVELIADKKKSIADTFAPLGVSARVLIKPDVDIRDVRSRLGLSQAEFACDLGSSSTRFRTGNRVATSRTPRRCCC